MQINSKHPLYRLARDTYPEYTGRRVFVQATHEISFFDLNWSGGTKRTYTIIRADGASVDGFDHNHPAHNQYEGKTVPMSPEYMVIVRSWFCGKDAGITVYTYAPAPLAPAARQAALTA